MCGPGHTTVVRVALSRDVVKSESWGGGGGSCCDLKILLCKKVYIIFQMLRLLKGVSGFQTWRVEKNLFTRNIRGFVDFGKQAEPKNPCVTPI